MLAATYQDQDKHYKEEQVDLNKQALELEAQVKESDERAAAMLEHHHLFALSVTLFQVAIALSAIALLSRQRFLWIISLFIGAGGLGIFIRGFALIL